MILRLRQDEPRWFRPVLTVVGLCLVVILIAAAGPGLP